jgi:hypothetical protein
MMMIKIKFIKNILLLLFSFFSFTVLAQVEKRIEISVENNSTVNFNQHVLTVPWKDVIQKYPTIDTANFKVLNASTKKEIPFQLEYRGASAIQNLLIQVDVATNRTLKIYLLKGKPLAVLPKTYCRYVPERKDDFAWENDRIAFRMYGKALEGTKENAYGIDVWVKRTDRLVLNERYKRGAYHIDHGDGLDYYHVGFSLGAGNIAPCINDSIWYAKNYRQWKVLDNGPLRSTFQLSFDEWDVAGRMVKMVKTVSLDAGSQLSRIEVNYSYPNNDSLPVVVGIIKRKELGTILLDEQNGIMGYWEPQHGNDGITGTGTVFLQPVVKMKVNHEHLLAHFTAVKEAPFVYYTGAAWNKAGIITNAQNWFSYLQLFQQQLQLPLQVKLL